MPKPEAAPETRPVTPQEKLETAKFNLLQELNDAKKAALRGNFSDEEKQAILDAINDAWSRIVTCRAADLFAAAHLLWKLRRGLAGDLAPPRKPKGRRQPVKDVLASAVTFALLIYAKQRWRGDTGSAAGVDDVAVFRRKGGRCSVRWTLTVSGNKVTWDLSIKDGKCDEAEKLVHTIRNAIQRCDYPSSYDVLQLSLLLEWLHWVVE